MGKKERRKEGEGRRREWGRERLTYCEELAHIIMEAEKFYNKLSADW